MPVKPVLTNERVADMISRAQSWYHWKDGFFRFVNGSGLYETVSAESLAQLHPVLPLVLEKAISLSGHSDGLGRFISGINIRNTARLLLGDVITLDARSESLIFADFSSFEVIDEPFKTARGSGEQFIIKNLALEGEPLPFVIYTAKSHFALEKTKLDAQYPGWDTRYLVSQNLGLEMTELGRYLFPAQTADIQPSPLPNIEFD